MSYQLWYWPGIPGRGEFIRLPLEGAGVAYRDMARELGADALAKDMDERQQSGEGIAPFAPPYLVDDDGFCIAQTAHILAFLSDRHGLGGKDLKEDLQLIQLALTVLDIVDEVHDGHHPIASSLYFEDQKEEAMRRAHHFREERIGKYCDYFEQVLAAADGPFVLGGKWTFADTAIFQLMEGLHYSYPKRMGALAGDYPLLARLREAVGAIEGIAAYRASERYSPFNENGIFRHYPELDAA